jgi:hypothetical protein
MSWRAPAAEVSVEPTLNDDDLTKPSLARCQADAVGFESRFGVNSQLYRELCGFGVQGEEAHHVASDREPKQMDAGLDLAAQG